LLLDLDPTAGTPAKRGAGIPVRRHG